MTKTSDDGHKELIYVPDRQMENFIKVASAQDNSISFLDVRDSVNMGRRVRITAGRFKGVEGVIKGIKKNKYFLIQIDGVAAVAITYVPADCLESV
jgi:transcription antitermination factor NusG